MEDRNVISLYNALHEEPISEDVYIRKVRVDNVLYMTFCNDISFGIDDKTMVFAEHQSTINKNMPLRSLLYAGRAYEKIVPDYLRRKGSEVINMLFGDYNYDDDIRVQREEEREDVLDVCAKLLANGRQDEIMKAASDKVYRQKLFKEFQV